MAGVWRGTFTCIGWQVTLCDPIWQVMSRSSEMGFPGRAISAFTFLKSSRLLGEQMISCQATSYTSWTDRERYDGNSWSYCMQYDRLKIIHTVRMLHNQNRNCSKRNAPPCLQSPSAQLVGNTELDSHTDTASPIQWPTRHDASPRRHGGRCASDTYTDHTHFVKRKLSGIIVI